ncbi:beta-N-acetylhexosaminidase [Streptomyces sp. WMMC500]|uniref:beta-N-acetylhexosaminidase n=1 Tax=Streptomyces sp. WMMC500 TaxID=3015154 RepID=UPI00248D12F9|nr:beta-N-acetylhexosaminidase [Streptomyces sp. WMMC500]WBB59062.1 beta-N-acetylhexosaminidase [Streptomyces sp. WMMC500]
MDLIPAPRSAARTSDTATFALGQGTVLAAGAGADDVARWLRAQLGAATGLPLAPGDPDDGTLTDAVRLAVDPALALAGGPAGGPVGTAGPEAYRLEIGPDGVRLTGGGPAGLFWGAQTLRQLLGPRAYRTAPLGEHAWELPHCRVEDAPRFGWRGFMLDVSRHFLTKREVLRHLDLMAAHKLNVLHFHLTDDQGWRIEIKRHPKLAEDASWRPRTKVGHRASDIWDERPHGGFYTQDDIREIVAYAAARHITVVPEVDIPGHSQAAIHAYPWLGNTDVVDTEALGVWCEWGVSENVLAPTEEVLRFYEGVFEEVLDLFPSTFVHVGGDECPKHQWKSSPAAQARIRELGLADEDELQSWFIRHFDRWLADRGRRLIGWDEILEGGLADGATVSSWRGYAGGIAAARAGHDVVMCPEQQVYLNYRESGAPDEPVPIAQVRTLEDFYRFEPVPPQLDGDAAARVIGTQANVWSEVLESPQRFDYQVYPRLAAFAEVAWSALPPSAERDFAGFAARMEEHYGRLDALGVDYRPPGGPRPWQRRPGVLGRPIEGPPPIV